MVKSGTESDDAEKHKSEASGKSKKQKTVLDNSIEEVVERLTETARREETSTSGTVPHTPSSAVEKDGTKAKDIDKKRAEDRKSGRFIKTGTRPAEYCKKHHTTLVQAAATARRKIGTDTEEIELPQLADLPGILNIGAEYFVDPVTPSFFLAGPLLRRVLLDSPPLLESFEMRYMRNDKPRSAFIGGYCGHFVCSEDYHLLCRSCDYVSTRLLCYKPDECDFCAKMSKAERERRRDRNNRAPHAVQLSTFGGRYEARHHMHRLHYLEGILWCLAQCYEHVTNITALRKLRGNIKRIAEWSNPRARRNQSKIPGDVDGEEEPHVPSEGLTDKQKKNRDAMAREPEWMDEEEMMKYLEKIAHQLTKTLDPGEKRLEMPPLDVAIAELPVGLFLKNDDLLKNNPELYTARCSGYNAFRHEDKLRVFVVKMKPLSREEQKRLKLDRYGGQLVTKKRKKGENYRKKAASLRLPAKKLKGEEAVAGAAEEVPASSANSPATSDADTSQDEQGSTMGILTLSASEVESGDDESSMEIMDEGSFGEIDDEDADPLYEAAGMTSSPASEGCDEEDEADGIAVRVKSRPRTRSNQQSKIQSSSAPKLSIIEPVVSIQRLGGFSSAETARALTAGFLGSPSTTERCEDDGGSSEKPDENPADVSLLSDDQTTGLSDDAMEEVIESLTCANSPKPLEEATRAEVTEVERAIPPHLAVGKTRTKATIGVKKRTDAPTPASSSTAAKERLDTTSASDAPKMTEEQLLKKYKELAERNHFTTETDDVARSAIELAEHMEETFFDILKNEDVFATLAMRPGCPVTPSMGQLTALMSSVQAFVERNPHCMVASPNPFSQLVCLKDFYTQFHESLVTDAHSRLRGVVLEEEERERVARGEPPLVCSVLEDVNRGTIAVCDGLELCRTDVAQHKEEAEREKAKCTKYEERIKELEEENVRLENDMKKQAMLINAANSEAKKWEGIAREAEADKQERMLEARTVNEEKVSMQQQLAQLQAENEKMKVGISKAEAELAKQPPSVMEERQAREGMEMLGVRYGQMRSDLIQQGIALANAEARLQAAGLNPAPEVPSKTPSGSILGSILSPSTTPRSVSVARRELENKYVSY